jgi:hypothetical protein
MTDQRIMGSRDALYYALNVLLNSRSNSRAHAGAIEVLSKILEQELRDNEDGQPEGWLTDLMDNIIMNG